MCGILGIVGDAPVKQRLIDGLKRLEYRGYDSSGIALCAGNKIFKKRTVGKIDVLEKALAEEKMDGFIGIGHTRWATHGGITKDNAHPHGNEDFVLVHNGIIENHEELRASVPDYRFQTQTDTEIIVALIEQEKKTQSNIQIAILNVCQKLKGHFAIVLFFKDDPSTLIAIRQGSPLAVGFSKTEGFVGSDALSLSVLAETICYLENGDIAFVQKNALKIMDRMGKLVERNLKKMNIPCHKKDKENYSHYMLKEIHEQPCVIQATIENFKDFDLSQYEEIRIIACGTSFYAGLLAKYWFEMERGIRTNVELASEFRYAKPLFHSKTCAIVISQSGETIDTLSCLYLLKDNHIKTLGIINVRESSIARMVDHVIYTEAGLEVGVASTKALTAQLVVLALLANKNSKNDLSHLRLNDVLSLDYQEIALFLSQYHNVLFLGRGISYPLALEGALKLKEISYIHAQGYAAGEMKHGPIALIDENFPVVCLAPFDQWFEKTLSNIHEVLARGAMVVLLTDQKGAQAIDHNHVKKIILPESNIWTAPFLYVASLQLIAYYVACLKGTDIDQPRNLAKSVTVE
jgi:glucosamine--fructose-6-phosphate aminotransferase (isomerizing)